MNTKYIVAVDQSTGPDRSVAVVVKQTKEGITIMQAEEMELHTEPPHSLSLKDVIDAIESRPDQHCRFCHDFFDEKQDSETMEIVRKIAQTGASTKQIYAGYKLHLCPEAKAWPPRMHEMIVLHIEHEVRQHRRSGLPPLPIRG